MNKYLFMILAGGLLAFTSCSDDIVREPSPEVDPNCPGAYFSADNQYEYELEPEAATEITLTLARTNTGNAATVNVEVLTNTNDVFEVPEAVSFAAGEGEAALTIKFPNAEVGTTYNYELKLADDAFNPYVNGTVYASGEVTRVKWNDFETTIYIDGVVSTFFGAPYPVSHYVTAQYAVYPSGNKRVRITNPFAPATALDQENGIYVGYPNNGADDMVNNNVTMIIDIEGREAMMSTTRLGFDWGYGEFITGTIYPNVSSNKNTYPLGVVTSDASGNLQSIAFGSNSLFAAMTEYNNAGAYPAGSPTYIFFSLDAWKSFMESLEAGE